MSVATSPSSLIAENIPQVLKDRPQWVCWRREKRVGKVTKIPYSVRSGQAASSTDPSTWATYDEAMRSYERGGCTGIGYVFSSDDDFCGVDLDNSRDPDTGTLKPWAQQIVNDLDSYTEVSPSGRGVKIFLLARKPGDRCRRKYHDGEIEIYDKDRFFTLTGWRLDSASHEINECQDVLAALYNQVFGLPANPQPPQPSHELSLGAEAAEPVRMTDDAVLRLASSPRRRDGKGEKFAAMWDGQWNDYFNSASEADASMVFTLAYYTKDREQLDRLFRRSKLFREKWDERHGAKTYGQMTIDKALEIVTAQYRPRKRQSVSASPIAVPAETANLPDGQNALPDVFLPGGPVPILTAADQMGHLMARADKYFLRGGPLVTLAGDDDGQPILETVKPSALASIFESVAQLKAFARNHGQFVEVPTVCSEQNAKVIMNAFTFRRHFPVIRLISRCPVLIERDGKLVQVCGYDRDSGILSFGEPAPDVSLDDAVNLLSDMLADFHFATPADRVRALAAIITPAMVFGNLLGGRAPVDLGEADASQTGKGFRNKLTASIYGQSVRTVTQKRGGVGSMGESFNTALVRGDNFICFDNVRGSLDSPSVESFLTEDTYLARVPHQVAVEVDPRRVIVQLTSNKADITVDLANRSSCVRIVRQPQGYQYRQYAEGDVLDHVRANQPLYLGAVFAVVKDWHTAGKHRTTETRHDFRPWARAMDWIVQNIFHAGPLLDGHRETQVRMATPNLNWLRDVALAVRAVGCMDRWLRASDLVDIISETADLELPGLPEGGELTDGEDRKKVLQAVGRRLGQCFGDNHIRVIDQFGIERQETEDKERGRVNKQYYFRLLPEPVAASPYAQDGHRGRIGGTIGGTMRSASSPDPADCARAQEMTISPYHPPMLPLCNSPMETAISPIPPMGSEEFYPVASAQRKEHSSAVYIDINGTHRGNRGDRGNQGASVMPVLQEDEELV